MRVALLVPVVVIFAQVYRNAHDVHADADPGAPAAARPPLLPGFLVAFIALVALNSIGVVPRPAATFMGDLSRWCLVVAIAALGVKTSFRQLAELGWQPVVMIVGETLFIAAVVLGGVALLR
jgi:uncharacterized membrane protein YadS